VDTLGEDNANGVSISRDYF